MIDIHSHILTHVDDGSNDEKAVMNIIQQMCENGVTTVFATPHYLKGMYNTDSAIISNAIDKLKALVKDKSLNIDVRKGCEVYLTPNSLDDIKREGFVYENTDYCLVECNVNSLEAEVYHNIYKVLRAGYKPVIAHPERYQFILKSTKAAKELLKNDVYFQINSGSLLGFYGNKVKGKAWNLLANGFAHFVASDTHCKETSYNLKEAYDKVVTHIDKTTADLLFNIFPKALMNNGHIPIRYVEVKSHSNSRKKSLFRWI